MPTQQCNLFVESLTKTEQDEVVALVKDVFENEHGGLDIKQNDKFASIAFKADNFSFSTMGYIHNKFPMVDLFLEVGDKTYNWLKNE